MRIQLTNSITESEQRLDVNEDRISFRVLGDEIKWITLLLKDVIEMYEKRVTTETAKAALGRVIEYDMKLFAILSHMQS